MVLHRLGPAARPVVPQLSALLRRDDPGLVRTTVSILGNIGPDAKAAVPGLVWLLKHGNEDEKVSVIFALRWIGFTDRDAREALPPLIVQIRTNADVSIRVAAVKCLGIMGQNASPAVPTLIAALRDSDTRARAVVAMSLGQIGSGASDAAPALTELLGDEWWYVRENAATALGKIGPAAAPAIPSLLSLAQSDLNEAVRSAASEAVKSIQKPTAESTAK